jgi:hypothetical protein
MENTCKKIYKKLWNFSQKIMANIFFCENYKKKSKVTSVFHVLSQPHSLLSLPHAKRLNPQSLQVSFGQVRQAGVRGAAILEP